jgi:hypothetical protein
VYVIGYFPPDGHSISQKDGYTSDPYITSATAIIPRARDIFAKYGFPLFDYVSSNVVGVRASEFIDTDHPSDKADLRMLIDMAERDRELARHVDLPHLRALLANTQGDFMVTEYESDTN